MHDHATTDPTLAGMAKILLAWITTLFGLVTLQHLALLAATIYSVLQTYVLWRDKIAIRNRTPVVEPAESSQEPPSRNPSDGV